MDTKEITVYELNDKHYCEDCRPRGGTRSTLVVSTFTPCCAGCGVPFRELAEAKEQVK